MKNIFDSNYKNRLLSAVITSAFLCFTICVFGPVNLFASNKDEFWFGFDSIILIIAAAFLVMLVLMCAVLPLFKGKIFGILSGVELGIGIGAYLQGNFLFNNYGSLNGQEVDWGSYAGWAVLNTIIWIVCIGGPVVLFIFKRDMFFKIIKYISLSVLAVQAITLTVLFTSANLNKDYSYSFDKDNEFELSSDENIVVFVLDTFDSQYFYDFIKKNEDYKELLKGFTYYRDTVGGAGLTKVAMPYIMTGYPYNEEVGFEDYLESSFNKTPLYRELHRANYQIEYYTNTAYEAQINKVDNIINNNGSVYSRKTLGYYLYKLTAFSYAPHILKPLFWMYSGDFNEAKSDDAVLYDINDALFYSDLINNKLKINNEYNKFALYHLSGTHMPYDLNEEALSVATNKTSLEQNIKGLFKIIEEYFNQAKELNIYDNTTFVIMADHGGLNKTQNPLLLIKEKNSGSAFSISEKPVAFTELIPTILHWIGVDYTKYGKTFYDIDVNDSRERLYYHQEMRNSKDVIVEYAVNGKAYDKMAISETGIINTGKKEDNSYKLGTTIHFDLRATAARFIDFGFDKFEEAHAWTNGTEA